MHQYYVARCCLFEAPAGAKGVQLSCIHSVELDKAHYTDALVWSEEVGVARCHLLGHSAGHEHQMIWVVEAEVAALLETGTVLHHHLTFPILVATAELAVVHHFAVMPVLAVDSGLA